MTATESPVAEIPPHDLQAERETLGGILLLARGNQDHPEDEDTLGRVLAMLAPADFYREQHGAVFNTFCEMRDAGTPIDVVLLREELLRRGLLEKVGGTSFIASIVRDVPSAANAEHYAKIVFRHARARTLANALKVAHDEVLEGNDAAIEWALEKVRAAQEADRPGTDSPADTWDAAEDLEQPDPPPPSMFVDRLFVRPGVHIVFGPAQSGKSWALMAVALDAVLGGGCFLGADDLQVLPLRELRDGREERTLWIFGSEDTRDRVRRRVRRLIGTGPHAGKKMPKGTFRYATPPGGVPISTAAGQRWLEGRVRATGASILVIDTVTSCTAGALDVNKTEQVAPFLAWLHGLRDQFGLLVFLVHHTRKGPADPKKTTASKADSMMGSSTWRSQADGVLLLDAHDGQTQDVTVVSIKAKDVANPIASFHATLEKDTSRFRPLEDDETPPAPEPVNKGGRAKKFTAEAVLGLRGKHPHGLPWRETVVAEVLNFSHATWSEYRESVATDLVRAGCAFISGELRWPS